MRALQRVWWLVTLTAGCGPLALEDPPAFDAAVTGFDAAGILSEFGNGDAAPSAPRDPLVQIMSPADGSTVGGPSVVVRGVASDDTGIASVAVRIGPNQALLASSSDNFRSWSVDSAVPPGDFSVVATARDLQGNTSAPFTVRLSNPSALPDDAPPSLQIREPADGSSPLHPLVLVRGTATDDRAVVAMEVTRNGEPLTEREVETDDFFASWSRLVPLLPGEQNVLVFSARDAAGHVASAQLTLQGRASTDRSPPVVALDAPGEGAQLSGPELALRGTSFDDVGVREVKARIGRMVQGSSELVWDAYQRVRTSDGYATFEATLQAPSGSFQLEVRAIDLSGLGASVTRTLTSSYVPPYGDEVRVPLRIAATVAAPTLSFALDRAGIDEVFSEQIQRDTTLLELDTSALITNSVEQIKNSCGTRWRENDPDPRHDCSATDYGKDRSPPVPWQRTPEYSMVRLLTMTPANVVVAGTSLGNLQSLADALQIGGGFHDILADTMGIPLTQEIVPTAAVVRALQELWMQTHPNVAPGARLPITLYDAMHELMPLAERFGPAGDHPGLLDPAFPPRSTLLTPEFEMRLRASSNLQWLDGVDTTGNAGRARKDYLALVVDRTGPTFDDVLEFDFNDPARFDVVGLVEAPRADMRMLLRENPAFVRTCTGNASSCQRNLPATPLAGYVWANPKHQIESVVGAAAYFQYQGRSNYSREYSLFFLPAATVTVGAGGNPPGWASFSTLVNLGDPPPPQYLWETIGEVAQVALHSFSGMTLPEGQVNVAFSLRDVDVGLSAEGIRNAMRPRLQEQRSELSERLLGDYARNNGPVDFFYALGTDQQPYLYFIAPDDPRAVPGYAYQAPGFFADEALTMKLSTTTAGSSGDSTHEKLALTPGTTRTVYMRDDTGATSRLHVVVPMDASEIEVFVSRKVL